MGARKKTAKKTAPTRKIAKGAAVSPERRAARQRALAQIFAALGATDPDAWARTHAAAEQDGIARFVLLRALWMKTVEPGRLLGRARAHAELGRTVDRLLGVADLADLDALVRLAQETALLDVITVLDDPADDDEGIHWGVFRRDARGQAMHRLEKLTRDLLAAKP